MTRRGRYTDEEMAVLADRSIKANEAAEITGLTLGNVYAIRKKMERGTLQVSDWLDSEVDFIVDNFNRMTTYAATCNALCRYGLTSKPDFERMPNGNWRLFWDLDLDLADDAPILQVVAS